MPIDKFYIRYCGAKTPKDMPPMLLEKITHFFRHHKDLREDKRIKLAGWSDTEVVRQELPESIARTQQAPEKPCFYCLGSEA